MKVSKETIENLEKGFEASRFSEVCQVKTFGLRNSGDKNKIQKTILTLDSSILLR
jgi:hypothetical protein